MASINSQFVHSPSLKALIFLLLISGLVALIYAISTQNLLIAGIIISLPFIIFIVGYGLQNPRFVYLLYTTYAFFFTTVSRYIHQDKLSVGLDIILVYLFISLLFVSNYPKRKIKLNNAINILTVSYIVWILFTLFQLTNPGIHSDGITVGVRNWILATFVFYIVASLVSDTPKTLKYGLIVIAIFTIIAFLKLLYQKYAGFDFAEKYWLYVEGAAGTHILSTGIRYFSYFTDAGNFGTYMGAITIIYFIVGFNTSNRKFSVFYITIAIMGTVGMLMSGTRSALAVPLVGLALYCLLCKSIKIFTISLSIGITLFAFLAFTEIGNGNQFIRRARTAFRPNQDASFNVRIENRKEIAKYLQNHPWGVGLNENIPKMWQKGDIYVEGTLPPDSYFVSIWIQTGLWGLILIVFINIMIISRCCYIVLFNVNNRELRQTLISFTCAIFGILISGYTGNSLGQPPTNFLIGAMIAFVMNGAYIDKQITQQIQ